MKFSGIKKDLMPHQAYNARWMLLSEYEGQNGGFLADTMGLGKSLSAITVNVPGRIIKRKGTTARPSGPRVRVADTGRHEVMPHLEEAEVDPDDPN